MHNHQTFIPMVIECECCGLPNEFTFTTKHDRVICKSCLPHTGTPEKQQRKLRDHVGLYRSELVLAQEERENEAARHRDNLRDLQAQHQEEVDQIAAKNAELRAALHDGATNPAVDRWLADEAVTQAREHRDRAYKQRDHALAAIWEIARLHHSGERSDLCSCGKPERKGRELGAVKPEMGALQRWEDVQVERLLDGRDHGLPDNHPEVLRMSGRRFGNGRSRAF
jgi:hypothetical protein